jgi:hypothetical protein
MAPNGNIGLFERYRDAWRRINSAIKLGFYFEAIAIEESILSNRIISFLYGVRKLRAAEIRGRSPRFVCLIKLWREACEESSGYWQNPGDLIDRVNAWRAKRNDAVHALTRAFPGEAPPISLEEFLKQAEIAANEGAKLAREVGNWHRRQLRKARALGLVPPRSPECVG